MTALLNHLSFASLMACPVILAVCGLRALLRRQLGSRVVYAAWLLVAIRLLMPAALPVPVPARDVTPLNAVFEAAPQVQQAPAQPDLPAITPAAQSNPSAAQAQAPIEETTEQPAIRWQSILALGWGIGVCATAGIMLLQNARYARRMRAHLPTRAQAQIIREAFAQAGVGRIPVRIARIHGPCLFGAQRPKVLLPKQLLHDPDALAYALLHEACHAASHDTRWALLRNALCCLFWFHPLVWLAAHFSRVDAELACDARVLRRLPRGERYGYAQALVQVARVQTRPTATLATGVPFDGARLKARIQYIVEEHPMKKWITAAASALLMITLLASFAVAAPQTGLLTPEEMEAWAQPRMTPEQIDEYEQITYQLMDAVSYSRLVDQNGDLLEEQNTVYFGLTEKEQYMHSSILSHFSLYEDRRIGITPEDEWQRLLADALAVETLEDARRLVRTDYLGINQAFPGQPQRADAEAMSHEVMKAAGIPSEQGDPIYCTFDKYTYYGGYTPFWGTWLSVWHHDMPWDSLRLLFTPDMRLLELELMPLDMDFVQGPEIDEAGRKMAAEGALRLHEAHCQQPAMQVMAPVRVADYTYGMIEADPVAQVWIFSYHEDEDGNVSHAYDHERMQGNVGAYMRVGTNSGRVYRYDAYINEAEFEDYLDWMGRVAEMTAEERAEGWHYFHRPFQRSPYNSRYGRDGGLVE